MQMRTIIIRKNILGIVMRRLLLLALLVPLLNFTAGLTLAFLLFPSFALAADSDFVLVIKDHQFHPAELTIPSGSKVKFTVENQDATPEEFDSHALNREKMIAGHGSATIYIGPLDPGRYPFTGEFHESTAQGVIIAR